MALVGLVLVVGVLLRADPNPLNAGSTILPQEDDAEDFESLAALLGSCAAIRSA